MSDLWTELYAAAVAQRDARACRPRADTDAVEKRIGAAVEAIERSGQTSYVVELQEKLDQATEAAANLAAALAPLLHVKFKDLNIP